MALIPCAACERQISDMAPSCPGCGHPAAIAQQGAVAAPRVAPATVQTIEQTSKQFKVGQLIGAALIIGSMIACSGGHWHASPWLFILGVLIYIGARMGAWWNNG